jgi:hypothetical protein
MSCVFLSLPSAHGKERDSGSGSCSK